MNEKSFEADATLSECVRAMDDEALAQFLFHVNHSSNKALNRREILDMLQRPAGESAWFSR